MDWHNSDMSFADEVKSISCVQKKMKFDFKNLSLGSKSHCDATQFST